MLTLGFAIETLATGFQMIEATWSGKQNASYFLIVFFSFRPIVFGGLFLESLGNFSSPKSKRMKTPVQANKPAYFVLITDGFIM